MGQTCSTQPQNQIIISQSAINSEPSTRRQHRVNPPNFICVESRNTYFVKGTLLPTENDCQEVQAFFQRPENMVKFIKFRGIEMFSHSEKKISQKEQRTVIDLPLDEIEENNQFEEHQVFGFQDHQDGASSSRGILKYENSPRKNGKVSFNDEQIAQTKILPKTNKRRIKQLKVFLIDEQNQKNTEPIKTFEEKYVKRSKKNREKKSKFKSQIQPYY